jgi:ubiquinone/menaquinone biosynthesis C-methylase UbiE
MQGLLLAQFLWPDQYCRFQFFRNELHNFTDSVSNYLEIGAGHGLYVKEVLQQINNLKTVDVLDISETSLNLCKGLIKNDKIHFIQNDFLTMESSLPYDFISIAEVIEHLESPDEALRKIYSMLKDNGTVLISTPVNSPMIDHIHLFNSIEEIKNTIKKNNFEIIKETYKSSEPYSYEESLIQKVPIMYAAFIKKASS